MFLCVLRQLCWMYTFLLQDETRGKSTQSKRSSHIILGEFFLPGRRDCSRPLSSKSLMVLSLALVLWTSVCQWLVFKQSFSSFIFYFCSFLWLFSVRPMLMFEAEPCWALWGPWEPTAEPYPRDRWSWTPGKLPTLHSVLHWSDFKPHTSSMNLGAHRPVLTAAWVKHLV